MSLPLCAAERRTNYLQTFFSWYYPEGKGNTCESVGPNNPSSPTIEGSLDVQYIMAIGADVPTTVKDPKPPARAPPP